MFKYFSFLILLLGCHANASLINFESLNIDRVFEYSDSLKVYWDTNTTDNSTPQTIQVETFENILPGRNKLNFLTIEFELTDNSLLSLFAGLDAHYGAEIYINNTAIYSEYLDIWWSKNWNNRSVIELENTPVIQGQNTIEIFWAESCCNGANSILYTLGNSELTYLST